MTEAGAASHVILKVPWIDLSQHGPETLRILHLHRETAELWVMM